MALRQARRIDANLQARCRSSLLNFTRQTLSGYSEAAFHALFAAKLEAFLQAVLDKKSPRLMVFMPPRHGKSEFVSRRFPTYAFGKNPDLSIIATSYSADLSSRFNREVQRIIDDPRYGAIFPEVSLFGKNVRSVAQGSFARNSDIFEIVGHHGVYRSAGVGVGITGMGADILLIDDPIKDAADAASATIRQSCWDWYTAVAYTRLSPGGGIILCMTRWHEDDLAGRLLRAAQADCDQWDVLSMPAIAEKDEDFRKAGDALDPERYPADRLDAIRRTIGSWAWAGLYQQRPAPREGGTFKRAWFANAIIGVAPMGTRWVRHWDLAATAKKEAAYTAGLKLGKTPDGQLVIGDVQRIQAEGPEVRKLILATAQLDGTECEISLPQDPGQAGKVQARDMIAMLAGFIVHAEPETGSKERRAEPVAAQSEAGNLKLVKGQWNEAFIIEACDFPGGQFVDQIDALSGAFGRLTQANVAGGWLDFASGELARKAEEKRKADAA